MHRGAKLAAGCRLGGRHAGNANIDLFIIKLRGSPTDDAAGYAQSLIQGRGTFTWLADATQLKDAFTKIEGQVPISLVK